jgi:uncharacterized protein (TIGR02266 family)
MDEPDSQDGGADDDDSRGDPRAPIELKVEYKRLNSFFADYTKNISRGGTFIKTNRPLPIGTEFVFKLFVPAARSPAGDPRRSAVAGDRRGVDRAEHRSRDGHPLRLPQR